MWRYITPLTPLHDGSRPPMHLSVSVLKDLRLLLQESERLQNPFIILQIKLVMKKVKDIVDGKANPPQII